jgi:hypothetical protein
VCLGLNAKDLQWCENLRRVATEVAVVTASVISVASLWPIETLKCSQRPSGLRQAHERRSIEGWIKAGWWKDPRKENPKGVVCERKCTSVAQSFLRGTIPEAAAGVAVRRSSIIRITRTENGKWGCHGGDACEPTQVKQALRRGESQERGGSRNPLGSNGRKTPRGYSNPEGGSAAVWTAVASSGPANLNCAKGNGKSKRGAGMLRRAG